MILAMLQSLLLMLMWLLIISSPNKKIVMLPIKLYVYDNHLWNNFTLVVVTSAYIYLFCLLLATCNKNSAGFLFVAAATWQQQQQKSVWQFQIENILCYFCGATNHKRIQPSAKELWENSIMSKSKEGNSLGMRFCIGQGFCCQCCGNLQLVSHVTHAAQFVKVSNCWAAL